MGKRPDKKQRMAPAGSLGDEFAEGGRSDSDAADHSGQSSDVRESAGTGSYATRVGESIEMQLGEMLHAYDSEAAIASFGSPDTLASRLLQAVPIPSPWNDTIGPFYDSRQMATVLGGISRQALAERRKRRTVLALETADGVLVYPTLQIDKHGTIISGLGELLKTFEPDAVDGWTIAGWLVAGQQILDGLTPIAWLLAKRDRGIAVALAADANRRFSA